MPCFHFRSLLRDERPLPISADLEHTPPKAVVKDKPVTTDPIRKFCYNTSVCSFASSGEGSLLPPEDLAATKRRLVVIRRQSSYAPVNLSVGFKSRTGWQALRSSRHNQDSLVVLLPLPEPVPDYSLFAVFDGHGRAAHRLSSFVAQTLAKHFRTLLTGDRTMSVGKALRRACQRTTADVFAHPSMDVFMTGTTMSALAIHGRTLLCANVGDSRIVLGTMQGDRLLAIAMTTDHLPNDEGERRRVEKAGGRVECWSPGGIDAGPPRVWLKERRLPGLAVTRVIGDSILEGIVIPQPELTTHKLVQEDRFAVVATDGIWSVMSNLQVVEFVAERDHLPAQIVAELLVRHAAELWFEDESGGIDDITAIIVRFKP